MESSTNYVLKDKIGEGGFGKVFSAEKNGEVFAVKISILGGKDFETEVQILKTLEHPCVVKIYDSYC